MRITTRKLQISAFLLAASAISGSAIANADFSAPKSTDTQVITPEFVAMKSDIPKLLLKPEDAAAAELMPAGVKIIELEPLEEDKPAASTEQFYEGELISVLRAVGFEGDAVKHAWAVAMKESTGNPDAHNKNSRTGDNSYGLFQINMIGSLGPARVEKYGLSSYEDLFDPYINARVAYQMSNGGKDWGPWGIGPNAYNGGTTGSYYKWLEEYPGGR